MLSINEHYSGSDLKKEVEYLFSGSNPYFVKGVTKLFKQGKSSLIGFYHPEHSYKNKAFVNFGYWSYQSDEDQDQLFKDLKSWAVEMGADQILGPMNFSTLHSYRLPLDHYNEAFWGEPAGSIKHVEALLSQKFKVVEKYSTHFIKDPSEIYKWGMQRSKRVEKQSETLRVLSFKDLLSQNRKQDLYDLIELTFKRNVGYLKSSSYELNYLFNDVVLEVITKSPSFVIENVQMKTLCGIFVSFVGPNIFDNSNENVLFYKTIGAYSVDQIKQNQIFFYLIHQIFKHYKDFKFDLPISFALMREGNVAEKVAKKFSNTQRKYGLFSLQV